MSNKYNSFSPAANSTAEYEGTSLGSRETTTSQFQELPEKLLLKIFENFSQTELLQTVVPVCQNWKHAALHPRLWKRLTISGRSIPTNQICQKLRRFAYLENIFIKNIYEPTPVLRQISICTKNLKELILRYCKGIKEHSLRNLVYVCVNLGRLDLKGTEFKSNKFYQDLTHLKGLKSINLSGNRLLKKQNILTVVLNCRHLEEFILSVNLVVGEISEAEWSFIIRSMSPKLKSICIDATSIGNNTFHTILQCPLMEVIGYCGAYHLSGNVFEKLCEYPITLTTLKLRFAHLIDGNNISKVFTSTDMSKLKILDLTGCWKITDAAVDAIATCTNLEKLILKNCKRITRLNPVTEKCLEIEQLNVAFCNSLDIDKSLLSLPKLGELFINEEQKFNGIIGVIVEDKLPIKVRVCLSEYNKQFESFI